MSNDPSSYYGNTGGEAYPAPEPLAYPGEDPRRSAVQDRVRLPAVLLIITALFNFLGCLFILIGAIQATLLPEAEWKKQSEMSAQMTEKMTGQKPPPGSQPDRIVVIVVYWVWGMASLLCALLPLLGGIRMLSLKNYGLCVASSLAAALPCLSASGCCGLGELAGIWALVVLMNDEVRSLFR